MGLTRSGSVLWMTVPIALRLATCLLRRQDEQLDE
jgi:hypothetical protein